MITFEGKNANNLYIPTLKYILKHGTTVKPRGLLTKELYPAVTKIELPQQRFLSCIGRNINPFFLTAEALWILAGRGDVEWISYYNSKLKEYDDGSKISLSNIENCLCEFSKYMKTKLGLGRPRVLYKPKNDRAKVLTLADF